MKSPRVFFSHAKCIFLTLILCTYLPVTGTAESKHAEYVQDTIRLAKDGDAQAQFSLFMFYDEGRILEQDKQKALYWLTRSARQGLPVACLYLGMKYEFGNGVQQDDMAARRYYTQSAEKGWAMAQYFLAMLLIKESGEKNLRLAESWLQRAAENGYPGAEEQLGKLKLELTPQYH